MIDTRRARVFSKIDESIENRAPNNVDDRTTTMFELVYDFHDFSRLPQRNSLRYRTNVQDRNDSTANDSKIEPNQLLDFLRSFEHP